MCVLTVRIEIKDVVSAIPLKITSNTPKYVTIYSTKSSIPYEGCGMYILFL